MIQLDITQGKGLIHQAFTATLNMKLVYPPKCSGTKHYIFMIRFLFKIAPHNHLLNLFQLALLIEPIQPHQYYIIYAAFLLE